MAKDMLLVGASQSVLQADATTNYSSTECAEANSEMRFLSKAIAPAGPAGDVVFRRLHVSFSHTSGAAFRITPIVDGREITDSIRIVNKRPVEDSSVVDKYTAVVPLGEQVRGRPYSQGIRGSSIQILINTTAPDWQWHIEGMDISFQMASNSKSE